MRAIEARRCVQSGTVFTRQQNLELLTDTPRTHRTRIFTEKDAVGRRFLLAIARASAAACARTRVALSPGQPVAGQRWPVTGLCEGDTCMYVVI